MVAPAVKRILGTGGVPPGDNARAYVWERRLHPAMIGVALIALVAFYFTEFSDGSNFSVIGHGLEWLIFIVFLWLKQTAIQAVRCCRRASPHAERSPCPAW